MVFHRVSSGRRLTGVAGEWRRLLDGSEQGTEPISERLVPIRRGVLVAHGHVGRRVAEARHQLGPVAPATAVQVCVSARGDVSQFDQDIRLFGQAATVPNTT